ncbi:MAG: 50S ribosomal protein L23 [Candidatus Magasanikbacteria bacterium]|nr:50S ribosomal protein L23 [Candidatus Magasanikbacteria bacterium]
MGLLNRKKKEEKPVEPPEKFEAPAEIQKGSASSVSSSRVIVKPLVTEKAAVAQSLNKYAFIVRREATKEQIKKAVNDIYGVMPVSVNVIHVEGKARRYGQYTGRRGDFKKAFVTLPKGKTIAIHEGV